MRTKAIVFATLSVFGLVQPAFAEGLLALRPLAAQCQATSAGVVLRHQGQDVTMRSIGAQMRTAARAFGLGGVAQYAVLPGARAAYRLPTTQPTFVVAAPSNVQPQGLFTLALFQARPNGSREVLVGGGFVSYSTGISPDRIVAVNAQLAAKQTGAPTGFTLYEITPQAALAPGEYALVVTAGQAGGGAPMLSGPSGTFYDFGVD